MVVTPQFIAGLVIGVALGAVGLTVIAEWVSVCRSERAFKETQAAKRRPPLTLVR